MTGATDLRIPEGNERRRAGRRAGFPALLAAVFFAATGAAEELATRTGPSIGARIPDAGSSATEPSLHAATARYEERRAGLLGMEVAPFRLDPGLEDEEVVRRAYPMFAPESPLEDLAGERVTLVDAIDRWEALRREAVLGCEGDAGCVRFFDREDPRKRPVSIGHCGVFDGVWVRTVQLATDDGRLLGPRQQIRAFLSTPEGQFEFEAFREQITVEMRPGEPPRYVYGRTPLIRGRRLGSQSWHWAKTRHIARLTER